MDTIKNNILRKELLIYFVIAFAVPYLMGIPLYLCLQAGYDTSIFANAQMFYPAAGVMLAALIVNRGDANRPKKFFILYLIVTVLMIGCAVATLLVPSVNWLMVCNLIFIGASVVSWIVLAIEGKQRREAYGLRWHGGFVKPFALVLLFVVLYAVRVFGLTALVGGMDEYLTYWQTSAPYILLAVLIPNFFFCFLPFFGEEYGWRYFLQPRLEKKFGPVGGVLLLGVLWGVWHLPLNLFFYSPETSLQSLASQLIACVTLGVFFAFAYHKTNNIWVPVLLHYANNNLIMVFSGTADISNQVIGWGDVGISLVVNAVLFLPFLASKEFRKPRPAHDTLPQS